MSASLLAFVPLALLAIVLLLCFVGCTLDTTGVGKSPFGLYTQTTIVPHPALVAYWPLHDAAGPTATDLHPTDPHNGTYVDVTTNPDLPYPAATFGTQNSAAAPGTLSFAQPGIVPGDTVTGDPNVRFTCIQVDGGYVSVPFNAAFNPAGGFTIEAWVRVEWTAADPNAFRIVLDAREVSPNRGFALYANQDNQWEAAVGDGIGTGVADLTIAVGGPVVFEATSYLAVTFDGTDLILFVDGEQRSPTTPATYAANTAVPLFIGAGAPSIPLRPAPNGGPFFPFKGKIQCVAIYNTALPLDQIILHMHNGNGVNP
jgi:Concanavalin A-like lectin/glucanases superfamily